MEWPKAQSRASEWARKRNFAIWRIRGLRAVVSNMAVDIDHTLLMSERAYLKDIESKLNYMITTWKHNNNESKRLFKLNQK